jgi:hypothetical protein
MDFLPLRRTHPTSYTDAVDDMRVVGDLIVESREIAAIPLIVVCAVDEVRFASGKDLAHYSRLRDKYGSVGRRFVSSTVFRRKRAAVIVIDTP